jgi:hypothetical protein
VRPETRILADGESGLSFQDIIRPQTNRLVEQAIRITNAPVQGKSNDKSLKMNQRVGEENVKLADSEIKKMNEIMRIGESGQREDTVSVRQRRRTSEEIVEKRRRLILRTIMTGVKIAVGAGLSLGAVKIIRCLSADNQWNGPCSVATVGISQTVDWL